MTVKSGQLILAQQTIPVYDYHSLIIRPQLTYCVINLLLILPYYVNNILKMLAILKTTLYLYLNRYAFDSL